MSLSATRTRSRWRHGVQEFYDKSTQEIIHRMSPVCFNDDFCGEDIISSETGSTGYWNLLDTGGATETIKADAANGVLELAMDATSEAQLAGISFANQRPFVLNQGLMIQFVLDVAVLPTGTGEAVWGLAGDHNAVADTVAESIWFKVDGSGAVVCETDDGTTNNDDVASGVTLTAGTQAVFLIDCNDPTDIRFYIDGASVATGTTFSANATPALALQPYAVVAKASGTGLGTIDVDRVTVWQNRS